MPTEQTILEMEFADSESDSDDEEEEKKAWFGPIGISTHCGWPGIIEQTHRKADGSRGVDSSRDSKALSGPWKLPKEGWER